MRLFFKEPSKMDQQERFKWLYANMKNHESSEHAELEKYQDGAIIGDGRSDSTLETKSYTFLTLQKKPMLFFMLQKHPLLRKKEKREKKELLKRSKTNLICKQRYIPYTISRLTAQEP
ncbi:dynamin family protein [Helicobacter pylori]|nr:dynamin family protein [Helicobacter pylori]